MSTPETRAWDNLVDAIAVAIPDAIGRCIPPLDAQQLSDVRDALGRALPKPLLSLYSHTGGLDISGYLPSHFSDPMCVYSLVSPEELKGWHSNMLENHRPRGGMWPLFPHWLKTLTVHPEADGIWQPDWIPFATDGAAGLQFIGTGIRRGIYEYTPDGFGIRRCASSLAGYLESVAKAMRQGKTKPFDIRARRGTE